MGLLDDYRGGSRPGMLPHPPVRSFDEDVRLSHMPASAHARHFSTASGYLQYGIDLNCSWTVGGDGLLPAISPNSDALGWSSEYAAQWAREAEELFYEWGDDPASCDTGGRLKFSAMQSVALRSYYLTGDVIGLLDYAIKPAAAWRTAVNLIDPLRLRMPYFNPLPGTLITDGIELDVRGRSIAYHIRDLSNRGAASATRVPVYSEQGKRMVCHVFDANVGTIRGVSPLASAIKSLMQSMSAADAGVLAAHIHASVIGTLTADAPPEAILRAFGVEGAKLSEAIDGFTTYRAEWHEGLKENQADVQLGNGARVVHLSMGEKLNIHGSSKDFSAYDTIIKHGLREAARSLGLSYEHLTGDKSDATYSALKYASVETRGIVDLRRKTIVEPFCEWALESVIEEAIANGRLSFERAPKYRHLTPLNAYRTLKRFALRTEWRGPSLPDPDELKSVKAAEARVQMGLSSLSDEIAATGRDPEDTFNKIEADREALRSRTIFLPQHEKGVRRNKGNAS
jgi:lambda family phage portal protein